MSLWLNKDRCYLLISIKFSHLERCHQLLLKILPFGDQNWGCWTDKKKRDITQPSLFRTFFILYFFRDTHTSIDSNVLYECSPGSLEDFVERWWTTFSLTSGINRRGGWEQFCNTRETKIKSKGRSKYLLASNSLVYRVFVLNKTLTFSKK